MSFKVWKALLNFKRNLIMLVLTVFGWEDWIWNLMWHRLPILLMTLGYRVELILPYDEYFRLISLGCAHCFHFPLDSSILKLILWVELMVMILVELFLMMFLYSDHGWGFILFMLVIVYIWDFCVLRGEFDLVSIHFTLVMSSSLNSNFSWDSEIDHNDSLANDLELKKYFDFLSLQVCIFKTGGKGYSWDFGESFYA